MKTLFLILSILCSLLAIYEVREYYRKSVNRVSALPVVALLFWAVYISLKFKGFTF